MEKHSITWRGIEIEITFTPEKFGMADHIELRSDGKTPLTRHRNRLPVNLSGLRPRGRLWRRGGLCHRMA